MINLFRIRFLSRFSVLLAGLLLEAVAPAGEHTVASPDGSLIVAVTVKDGVPRYRVERRGKPLVQPSRLGFMLEDGVALDRDFVVDHATRIRVDAPWEQPWGEKRQIECRYNELRLDLRQRDSTARRMAIVFRVFDDGLGFRYEWPEQESLGKLVITDERTEFVLAGEPRCWWIPAYQREHYEYLYRRTTVDEIDVAHTPATFESNDGAYFSIHEAALVGFSSMSLRKTSPTTVRADLAPWSDGVKVRATLPHRSPWRTIRVADDAAGLITNYLELNLNDPPEIDSADWIEPGKYVGIWWEMHLGKSTWSSGPRHGATNENTRRYIDFAAENGFDGVLVEGWNRGWDGDWIAAGDQFDFTTPYPDYDLEALSAYARERGVRLIGHNETGGATENYERQLTDAFALYERLGIRAVKTGYVNFADGLPRTDQSGATVGEWHYGQYLVEHHLRVLRAAARHRLMLDVHEPVKQTGLRRTYPNLMTAEGARGQEYNAWSADGGNPPEHTTILPFTRLLAGPMDFTPGIFDLTFPEAKPDNRVNTTLAKQLALYVVLYSPLQMAADLPENYAKHTAAMQFIRDVPTDWEDTRVLAGEIGDYVVIARQQRGHQDWFIGAITDEQARSIEVQLDFLLPGQTYVAEVYRDAAEADWLSNPTDYVVESTAVQGGAVLNLRLAPGGGQALRLRPVPRVAQDPPR